jgi:hypothetical protein
MNVVVEADFFSDLRALVSRQLASAGYTVDPAAPLEKLLRDHLSVHHRRVERRARRVEWSAELRAREPSLPEVQRRALARIQGAAEAGDDLNPYLSRQLASDKAFKKNDRMLNELGMQHLHLGEGLNADGMIRGTRELLFAVIKDDAAYFVDIFDHDNFGDDAPFLIAQASWPDLFTPAVGIGGGAGNELTAEQRGTVLRKGGNVMLLARDGTPYFPPGGGQAPSGISPKVVIAADVIVGRLSFWEGWCKANGADLANRVVAAGRPRPEALRLRFDGFEESGVLRVVDQDARVLFRFDAPPG